MGEPLYNLDAVRDALLIVADGDGIAISKRRITLSTSGVVPNIERAGAEIGVHAGGVAARGARRVAQRAGAAQPQISDRAIAGSLPQLSRRFQRQAHHLRIRHAQGRQRFDRRRQGAGAAVEGHPGQDQSHSVQSLAGQQIRMLRLGADREVLARSCSTPAMPRRCARRAGATFWRPAASSRARPRSCPRANAWRCAPWR